MEESGRGTFSSRAPVKPVVLNLRSGRSACVVLQSRSSAQENGREAGALGKTATGVLGGERSKGRGGKEVTATLDQGREAGQE